ncbi:hypothetical protein CDD83_5655 [Cordyceps sp. RAO-2017]|nr:hypothetical protein CDD83_5655 [Cordyceps sp. RAO-2017]
MATSTVTQAVDDIALEPRPRPASKGSDESPDVEPAGGGDEAPAPANAVGAKQRWNSPPINKYRVLSTFWSFFVVGMNDGSYGVGPRLLSPPVSVLAVTIAQRR